MAGAIDLPEVVQEWTADVSDYVAAMAKLIAVMTPMAPHRTTLRPAVKRCLPRRPWPLAIIDR